MMIAARNSFLMSGGKPWQNPYVTDGLVAMWDGEWNAGGGMHDDGATVWKDLVGNRDFSVIQGSSWRATSMLCGPSGAAEREADENLVFAYVECVIDCATSAVSANRVICTFAQDGRSNTLGILSNSRGTSLSPIGSSGDTYATSNTGMFSLQGIVSTRQISENGHACQVSGQNYFYAFPKFGWSLGIGNNAGGRVYAFSGGNIHRIAVYSRALTAAEVAANYAVDAARFGL